MVRGSCLWLGVEEEACGICHKQVQMERMLM